MTAAQFSLAIREGEIMPGDCVLYRYASPGLVQRLISSVQRRALRDLYSCETIDYSAPDAHFYTHAGMVLSDRESVEMTSPRARLIHWEERMQGVAEMAIVRPIRRDLSPLGYRAALHRATVFAYDDVLHDVRYPHREIALYWLWSWGWEKLRNGKGFEQVFRDRKRNVCSGSVIAWWQAAGVPMALKGTDAWPESWYPARLAVDSRFEVVSIIVTAESQRSAERVSLPASLRHSSGAQRSFVRRPTFAECLGGARGNGSTRDRIQGDSRTHLMELYA